MTKEQYRKALQAFYDEMSEEFGGTFMEWMMARESFDVAINKFVKELGVKLDD